MMTGLSAVLVLCMCSSVFSFPVADWWEDQVEESAELVNKDDDTLEGLLQFYGPSVQENLVFTSFPSPEELPTIEQTPDSELSTEADISKALEDRFPVETTKPNSALEEKIDQLVSKLKDQENKIQVLENESKRLLEKVDQVEQQTKVNNVIFLNVRETKNENFKSTLQKVLHVLNKIMKLRVKGEDISVALRVNSNSTEVRPIVVRFKSFETKMRVLSYRNRLNRSNIDVMTDYSELVNQKRKELMPFLLEKRSQGHKAFIIYDKLMVDGVKMSLEELQTKKSEETAEEVDPALSAGVEGGVTMQQPDEQIEEIENPTFDDCDYV